MSTFKTEGARFLDGLFPECGWQQLTTAKYAEVLGKLKGIQCLEIDVVNYITNKKN